ncbi:MAG: LysM peptidoglycan-binding domain-containing protein [Patescibacteria group bacterium]
MSYTVKSGDTLSKIASQNGMTLSQLLALNPQYQSNPNLIRPGEAVNVTSSSSASASGAKMTNGQLDLSGYAPAQNIFGTPTKQPVVNVTSNIASLRQQIANGSITPSAAWSQLQGEINKQSTTERGTEVQGSTLDSAKSQLFAPMTTNANGKIGQLNSDGSISQKSTTINKSVTNGAGTTSSTAFSTPGMGSYTVKSGDTLSKIASDNGLTTQQIISLNPQITNPDLINPGQNINVGTNASTDTSGGNSGGGSQNQTGNPVDTSGVPKPNPTGNPVLDAAQDKQYQYVIGSLSAGYKINPALTGTSLAAMLPAFIQETASQLEPELLQNFQTEMVGVKNSLTSLTNDYVNSQGQTVQDFQESLGKLRDQTSMGGGAERALEMGLTNSANRSLSSLDTTFATKASTEMNKAGAALGPGAFGAILSTTGSAPFNLQDFNAFGVRAPDVASKQVSNQGGDSVFSGSATPGRTLDFNYNPSMYTYGSIPASFGQNFGSTLNQLFGNYQAGVAATPSSGTGIKSSTGLTL